MMKLMENITEKIDTKRKDISEEHWLINANRSRVKRFVKNKNNKDKFVEYMFIDSGKIIGLLGERPPIMTSREEIKLDKAREEWEMLLAQGWRKTRVVW